MSIFVSTELEVIKEVDPHSGNWQNSHVGRSLKTKLKKDKDGICCMCWKIDEKDSLLYATSKGFVKEWSNSSTSDVFHWEGDAKPVGIHCLSNNSAIVGVDDGTVGIIVDGKLQTSWSSGGHLAILEVPAATPRRVVTGGRENDVKVWDLDRLPAPDAAPDAAPAPAFAAKNARPDELCLRRPVWVSAARLLPDGRRLAVATGHGEVRVYDPSSSQRRPVLDRRWGEAPVSALALRPDKEDVLLLGSARGDVAAVDLRKGAAVVGCYKRVAGGVRALECAPGLAEPVLYSIAADRYLRVHQLDSRELLKEVYLKLKPTCMLLQDDVRYFEKKDDLWDSMASVDDVKRKRKRTD